MGAGRVPQAAVRKSQRAAVGYMQDVVTLSDSLYREETARKVAEISIRQDLAGKEKQLADQEKSLRQRSVLIGLLIACLVLLTTLLAVAWRALHLRKKNEELLRKTSEIKDRLLMLGSSDADQRDSEVAKLMSELTEMGGQVPDKTLTPREREIASLCCDGLLSKEIADQLHISQRTVETHKNNIFRKLGINTTAELVELMKHRNP
ncbi:MAG: LuxR family transcriptional regulator [Bacteroidales bacterium]|nr:LuxR family transcriptional regulator [Bacteroidales bacterium]